MADNSETREDAFRAVARIATMANGSNKIAAALLTLANWTGGPKEDLPSCSPKDIVDTYKQMLAEIEHHETERGL